MRTRGATGIAQDRLAEVLVDTVEVALGYFDADLRVVLLNPMAEAWLGTSAEQAEGRHAREVLGEDTYSKALPYIEGVLEGAPQVFECFFIDAAGSGRHAQVSLSPHIVDGEVVGICAAVAERSVTAPRATRRPRHREAEEVEGVVVEGLTWRELGVLEYLPTRLHTADIAAQLNVSSNTVKAHLKTIYRKLGVTSRQDAVARALAARLLHDRSA